MREEKENLTRFVVPLAAKKEIEKSVYMVPELPGLTYRHCIGGKTKIVE